MRDLTEALSGYTVCFMPPRIPDGLELRGKIQVETAEKALALTGYNPDAQARLARILERSDNAASDHLGPVAIWGVQDGSIVRTDIMMALMTKLDSPDSHDFDRAASLALLEELSAPDYHLVD